MSPQAPPAEQLSLLKERVRARRPQQTDAVAQSRPVARVAVDMPLAHLDRPFDYLVPGRLDESAAPGVRVKVRFAGRDVDGFLVARSDDTEHQGALAQLRKVVSPEPVLKPQILEAARHVADRYAGTLADVLRLAVPPRHARVEGEEHTAPAPAPLTATASIEVPWQREIGGPAMLRRLVAGESPRAVWTALPGADWSAQLAAAAAAAFLSSRGAIVCLPDARDVARVSSALAELVGPEAFAVLTADLGPAARYRAFLRLSRGTARIAIGTRGAAWAPVDDLGLVAMWDDGDDLHAEQRAPYPHAREVLLLRAHLESAGALVGGYARSVEGESLVETGWAVSIGGAREVVRAQAPQVHITGESDREPLRDPATARVRVPRSVFEVVRQALERGPVLVHTPRSGYLPVLACERCREPARCEVCSGPLAKRGAAESPRCRWCTVAAPDPWTCQRCGGHQMRAPVVGARRTTEEWGRAFPGVSVVSSGGDHVVAEVGSSTPAIVIATPGAEPTAEGGYAGAVLLDTWLSLGFSSLRAREEAVRRWLNVCALVRPGSAGGRVIAVGEPSSAALQTLVRWDPAGFAARELADRTSARLTPAARMATVTAAPGELTEVLAALDVPAYVDVLGPVEHGADEARLVLRAPRARGAALSRALQRVQSTRSARKLPPVRVQVDPPDLG
jgi:primosomal protein N' (replication factor Y) (superfamily II helicase)